MNLRALRRRRSRKNEKASSPGQRRRRLGVAGDLPPSSSDRLLMAVCSGDADDIRRTLDDDTEARCCVTPEILNCACATGNAQSVAILLERCGEAVNAADGRGETAIHSAVRRGSTDVIRTLMAAGADINAQTKYERRTPLHLATAARKLHVLRFLLGYGGSSSSSSAADVNRADIYGSTPLHVASETGFSNATDALLRSGADPDAVDRSGWTPLHLAAANGHASIAEQLVVAGGGAGAGGVDRQNRSGRTPLHWACCGGHAAVVRLLLRHGASVELGDRNGRTAADHAATDEVRRLVDAGAEAVRFSVLSHLDSGAAMHYSTETAQLRRRSETTEKESESEEEESLLKRPLRFYRHCSRADVSRETGRTSSDLDNLSSSSSSLDGAPGVWPSDWTISGARSLPQRTSDGWSTTEEDPDDCSGERRDAAAQVSAFQGESTIGRTRQVVPMDRRPGHRWDSHSIRRPSGDGSPSTAAEASAEQRPPRRRPTREGKESPASRPTRTSGGSLSTIYEHENNSTSKRTEVVSERPSEAKSSSADIEFAEKSTEMSPLEDSGFDDEGSERRLKPKSVSAEDEDDENLARNVRSVLDRMSFASESETTLDDFVQRIRNSSNAYIDSFSSSLKLLVQNLETTKK